MLTKQRKRDDEDDDAFENGVLKDGKTWHVPFRMLDSMQRDVAKHFADAGKQQPSFVAGDATARQAKHKIYDEYDASIAQQYKNSPTGVGSHGPRGPSVGSACTVKAGGGKYGPEGAPGHWTDVDGELVCVADNRTAADQNTLLDKLYNQRDEELREEWRRR
jgi:hypothetical protein